MARLPDPPRRRLRLEAEFGGQEGVVLRHRVLDAVQHIEDELAEVFEAHFPGDYGNAEFAGKTAVFTISVHENKISELPELDDEFAKRFGRENGTLAGLRDDLRNRLEAQKRQNQRRALTATLLEKLMAASKLPVFQPLSNFPAVERDVAFDSHFHV